MCYNTPMNTMSVNKENVPAEAGNVTGDALPTVDGNSYTWAKRFDVVARYMLLGNARLVSEQTNISYDTLMDWKRSDWWPEVVQQLRRQNKKKTSDSLVKVVENSLEVVSERLENGDWVLNQKTGEMVRKPVTAKDAATIANNLLQRQIQVEDIVYAVENKQESVKDTLEMLAKEFQKLNRNTQKKEVIDVEMKEI